MRTGGTDPGNSLFTLVEPTRTPRPPAARRTRVCAEAGCATVLSQYNEADRCSVHQNEVIDPASLEGAARRPRSAPR